MEGDKKMGAATMIKNVLAILIILAILPTFALFVYTAANNETVAATPGLAGIINLVPYGVVFGLILLGIYAVYVKKKE